MEIQKELERINSLVPPLLLKSVYREEEAYPDLKKCVVAAIGDDEFPEEKKVGLRIMLERGDFDKMRVVENKDVAKKIDQFITREIKKSVKAGRLPSRTEMEQDEFIKMIRKHHDKKSTD